jgi:hypothetical protein
MISRLLSNVAAATGGAIVVAASVVSVVGQTSPQASASTELPGAEAVKTFVAAHIAKNFRPPKKPWGHPDIEGIFTAKDEYNTPFERPDEWAGRRLEEITPAEIAASTLQRRKQSEKSIGAIRQLEWVVPGATKGVSPFDFSEANSRPWFVIDPPDGKVPPLTAEGKARRVPPERGGDSYTDRSISERCLTYGALRTPGPYGNSHQIIQTPTHVIIRQEQIHEARIVPLDGRPHPNSAIRGWFGISRGHWDGNTLVVVTTNFEPRMDFRSSPLGNARVIERFTRIAPNKVEWSTTFDDPTTWTRPFTWSLPLTQDDQQMIFEFACHEGNTGIPNILSAARVADQKQAREAGR